MNDQTIFTLLLLGIIIVILIQAGRRCEVLARQAEYQKIRADWYKDSYFGAARENCRLNRELEDVEIRELDAHEEPYRGEAIDPDEWNEDDPPF